MTVPTAPIAASSTAEAVDGVAGVGIPAPTSSHPIGDVAGVGGMVMSTALGVLFALDRFGLLRSRSSRSEQSSGTSSGHSSGSPSPETLEAIRSRLVGVETRLGTMEQTMTSLDSRDRADAAVLARMEGMITGWGERMSRIEAALVTGGR